MQCDCLITVLIPSTVIIYSKRKQSILIKWFCKSKSSFLLCRVVWMVANLFVIVISLFYGKQVSSHVLLICIA